MSDAPSITPHRKKALICACSHGGLADHSALNALIQFKSIYKPDLTVHLGDAADTTSFRSGAHGTADEAQDPDEDVGAALVFLQRLEPDVFFIGNHEHRWWKLLHSPNANVASCARHCINALYKFVKEDLRATFVDHYDITRSWMRLGPYLLGHGWMFGESANRDHAETVGNCIIGHTHSYGVARGRVAGGATCISVGMLADGALLTYAHGRRATHRWTTSFITAEFTDTHLEHQPHIIRESMPAKFETICPRQKPDAPPLLKPPAL